jgi:DUF4097 and DUF4098 domain-containing protein YvlB
MRMLLRSIVLAGVTAALMPLPAAAQVYPDRIVVKKDVRVATATAYQRRDRSDSRDEQTERTTKTVHIGSDGSLDLANIAGDITVTRGGGSDATVEIVKTARGRDANDSRDLLSIVTVDVNERNGRAEIKAHYPNGDEQRRNGRRNMNVSIAYNVSAPANARVSIESISGNIKVTDIKGDVNANTISGDVKIAGASHISGAKSISGSIEVSDAQSDAGLDASSVSGDVILRRVSARRVDAGTVSGNVQMNDVRCDRVSSHSTSGTLTFSGPLAKSGRYEFKGFSGEVRVDLPANSGFEVEASTFSGSIRSDFPITTHGTTRRSLTGTAGDGSAVLTLTTFSGNIVIAKR